MERSNGRGYSIALVLRQLVGAAAVSAAVLLSGCGGGKGGSGESAMKAPSSNPSSAAQSPVVTSFTFTGDSYGMENPTFLSATNSSLGLVLRAAVASSMTDPVYRTVVRIDIGDPGAVAAGAVYSLAAGAANSFPGTVYFFNGHDSTLLQTVGGTITFDTFGSSEGQSITGSFHAAVVDRADTSTPQPSYSISASFSLCAGQSGAIDPAPSPVPSGASTAYRAYCASCHCLGTLDREGESAPELALKGGKLSSLYSEDAPGHRGITLTASELAALKILRIVN